MNPICAYVTLHARAAAAAAAAGDCTGGNRRHGHQTAIAFNVDIAAAAAPAK
jgi:hypothetical protein